MTPTRFARDNSPPEADLSSALADGHSALPAGIPAGAAVLAVGVLTVAIAAWFITRDHRTLSAATTIPVTTIPTTGGRPQRWANRVVVDEAPLSRPAGDGSGDCTSSSIPIASR